MKARITITAVVEFDMKPENYPEDKRTPEGMLQVELQAADDDTFMFLDSPNVKWAFKGETINEEETQ
jgi:hypothetical protein